MGINHCNYIIHKTFIIKLERDSALRFICMLSDRIVGVVLFQKAVSQIAITDRAASQLTASRPFFTCLNKRKMATTTATAIQSSRP